VGLVWLAVFVAAASTVIFATAAAAVFVSIAVFTVAVDFFVVQFLLRGVVTSSGS
jgi:hypothetical protein